MITLGNALEIKRLNSELEVEYASAWATRLRWDHQEDPHRIKVRRHLTELVLEYEARVWDNKDQVTPELIEESKKAKALVDSVFANYPSLDLG